MSEKEKPNTKLKEKRQHGTVTFPCAVYQVDCRENAPGMPFVVSHHWQEELEIIHLENGFYHLEVNMQSFEIRRECLIFLNSGDLHYLSCGREYVEQAVVFSPAILQFESSDASEEKLTGPLARGELSFPGILFADSPAFPELLRRFREICEIFRSGTKGYSEQMNIAGVVPQVRVKASLLLLLACLEENGLLSRERPDADARIEPLKNVIGYIRENYGRKIYLKTLAEIMNMNEQYFCRFFKKVFGRTPIAYINAYRIRKAAALLENTDLPVTEIGMACGFGNLGHFMEEFRKCTHESPLQYRITYRDKKKSSEE